MDNPLTKLKYKYPSDKEQNPPRHERNHRFYNKLLEEKAVTVDPYLSGEQIDNRINITLITKPSQHIINNILIPLQKQLQSLVCDKLWLTPEQNMHATIQEIRQDLPDLETCRAILAKVNIKELKNRVLHAYKLEMSNPLICYDHNAVALSFTTKPGSAINHLGLREHVYEELTKEGVEITARYFGPSIHITLARFNQPLDPRQVVQLVRGVEEMNKNLGHIDIIFDRFEFNYGLNYYGGGEVLEL